ncbi:MULTISPECIES: hypothetical protein [Empedobacter]|uniref:hypothetical protein n=1 Tax=Empedobacter TaxID=59734 RepID=UPI0025C0B209|nr:MULTISPECIES: hypothetical protein [unclassified Empedobacter]
MKKILLAFTLMLCLMNNTNAQSTIIGSEAFSVNLPAGYQRTIGTNDFSIVQWENNDSTAYGFIITENIDELKLGNISDDLASYMDIMVSNYSSNPKFKSLNTKQFKTSKGKETFQKQISYYNEELESNVYLQINIFKTKNFIYQVVNFGSDDFLKNSKEYTDYIINNIDLPF